ncbi:MAG: TlyA family RNA methyltransferase [Micrococcales bacterium]|nr:TlyA family RNA methyltransferase [Micrococcales bacterium]
MTARLDVALVERGLARSRRHAQRLIGDGRVCIGPEVVRRPATLVADDQRLRVIADPLGPDYVSRAAYKLAGALDTWGGPHVAGRDCMDVGAATGGFTDVLLRRGARHVVAVDVGHSQLDPDLRADPRVELREGLNARDLAPGDIDPAPTLVVVDVSFISLRLVLGPAVSAAAPHADLVVLVKPQFEVGREALGAGGVVHEPSERRRAVADILTAAEALGLAAHRLVTSSLPGPAGNLEYVLWLTRGPGEVQGRPHEDLLVEVFDGPTAGAR